MAEIKGLASLAQLDALAAASSAEIARVKETIPAKTSDLNNDSGYQTADDVQTAISSQVGRVYKPAGTIAFAELPELSADVLGNVYNISDKFTTDERFVDGASGKHPAGTNVAVIQNGEEYKFDVLAGAVDMSNYVEKGDATKVEASEINGNLKINGVETTVVKIATDEQAAAVINKYFPQAT